MRKSLQTGLTAGVLAMGLVAAPSFADIKVSDQLSLAGFIDMSAYEVDGGPVYGNLDQFEVDFMYKFNDKISARADVAQGGVGGGYNNVDVVRPTDTAAVSAMAIEQAYITYTSGPLSVMLGKFLSATGWESAEPTGTYQYSYSATVGAYGGYNTGVGASYTLNPMVSLYGALFASEWGTDNSFATPAGEAGVTLAPMEGVTVKGFYMFEKMEGPDYLKSAINAWGSYSKGPLLLAAEFNYLMNNTAKDDNGVGFLLFGNYKLMSNLSATLRYSQLKTDAMADVSNEITISPTLSLADNWWVLAEARRDIQAKFNSYGVETTITF